MKCIGEKCKRFFESDGHTWCLELDVRMFGDYSECELPNKIKEVRDDLLRKCELLEDILETGNDGLDELIDKME